MRGTGSDRSPDIFPARLLLTLGRGRWKLRFHAGKRQVTRRRDSLGNRVRSPHDGPGGSANYRNITGEGLRTLKGVVALVTIKQMVRQA